MADLAKGIKELLIASEENSAPKILGAMKSIVMTVRKHLDDAEEYEKIMTNQNNLSQEQKEKLDSLQNDISDKLTSLVMVAKGKNFNFIF